MSHIRNVTYISDPVIQVFEVSVKYIEGDGLTCMSQVGVPVNRGATGIKTNKRWIQGFKSLFFPGQGIVNK
jgi:hypothetical protein